MVPWKNQNERTWRRGKRIKKRIIKSQNQNQNQNQHGQATVLDPIICSDFIGQSSSIFHLADELSNNVGAEGEIVVEDNLISPLPPTANDGHLEVESRTIHVARSSDDEVDAVANSITVEDERIKNIEEKVDLYRTAIKGEWRKAQFILDANPSLITESITRDKEIALHIAAGAKQTSFVKKLVERMTPNDMILQNIHGNTALFFATTSGVVKIADLMVKRNKNLPLIRGFGNVTPLSIAVSYKHTQMVYYLLSVTNLKKLSPQEQIELLIATIHSDYYDIGLKILIINPCLATMKDAKNNNETALHVMARKPSALMYRRKQLTIWKKCIYSCINCIIKGIYSKVVIQTLGHDLVFSLWINVLTSLPEKEMLQFIKFPTRLLHDAARAGNVEFLIELISFYPDIVWEEDDDGKSIFHVAVEYRLENVFNLIHEIGGLKDFSAKYRTTINGKYNMLHLAAKLAAPNHLNRVSGAALQMQRELLWFKEVQKIVLPSQHEAKCNDPFELTPRELFTKEHKDLRKEGELWMKNTANSCMLVSTLIATVVFAAAFTVPGGNDNNTGIPIFRQKFWFTVFVISDTTALISSSASILMFLSILTSRYAEDDFLHSLPSKLLYGLASLFISIVCMVVAFSATFFMLYHNTNILVPTTVGAMAIIPITCFCVLQFKLWVDTFHNTYLSRFLFKPRRRKLFSTPLPIDWYRELEKEEK